MKRDRSHALRPIAAILLLVASSILFLGAARDCRTATIETAGAPVVEATATVESQVAALAVKVDQLNLQLQTVDSWTSIILASSVGVTLIAIPLSFFVYLVIHRVPVLRRISDRLKGKS